MPICLWILSIRKSAYASWWTKPSPRVLLAGPQEQARFVDSGVPVWTVEDGVVEGPETDDAADVHGSHLAYVLYTSGSTGQPKGVPVEQRSVARLVLDTKLHPTATRTPHRPGLQYLLRRGPPSRSGALCCTAPAWWASPKTTCSRPTPSTSASPRSASTCSPLTMVLFHQVAQENPKAFGGLEHLLFGAEAADPRQVARMRESIDARMVHLYGPTECTGFATWHQVHHPRPQEPLPIGRALSNTDVLVADRSLRPVPLGALGELCLGGPGLARGYLHRPAASAERFVPHPLGGPGERLYRTGDLARIRGDGRILFQGRMDHQVKIRGFRIEPGEVEAALVQHAEVTQALVLVRDAPTGLALVAYAVSPNGTVPNDLRRFLESRLPQHLVPAFVVVLDEMPVTPNGKVDRGALGRMELDTNSKATADRDRTPHEDIVAGIWADVLGRDSCHVDDDFFELGGHSLLATQAASRLQQAFGVEVPIRTLFEHPTVAGTAQWLVDDATASLSEEPALDRLPRSPGRLFPVSFSQLREWILESLQPGTTAYHIAAHTHLQGPLDPRALGESLYLLVARHEALRTALVPGESGKPHQLIQPPPEHVLCRVDLRELPPEVRWRASQDLMQRDLATPFDFAAGGLLRALLVHLDEDDHLWLLTFHHIIADGWSVGIFPAGAEPALRCPGQRTEPAAGPRSAARAAPPIRGLRRLAAPATHRHTLDHLVGYWRQQLEDSPPLLDLPLDRPRPPVQSQDAEVFRFELHPSRVERAEAFARAHQASLYMVLLTTLDLLLFRLTGSVDLPVGTFIANRNRRETAGILGIFTNTLVVRNRLEPHLGTLHNLARVQDTTLDAYAHQDLPFEKLLDTLEVPRSTAHSPLFQVMLSLHNLPEELRSLGDLEARLVGSTQRQANFDLEINLHARGGALLGEVQYGRDLFDPTTIQRWIETWQRLLETCLEHPERPLADLPLLTPAQRHQLVVETQGPPVEAPDPGGIHRAFAVQARATPEAIALDGAGHEPLVYGDLLHQVQRLARRLRRQGIEAGAVVALAITPGPPLVVALLAVLEAGGTYLPLDLDQPTERLAFVLDDARVRCLLASTSEERRHPLVERVDLPVLLLEDELAASASEPAEPLGASYPEQLAYILYTSGTTGEPKGVGVPHRAVLDFLHTADQAYGLRPGDRILQFARPHLRHQRRRNCARPLPRRHRGLRRGPASESPGGLSAPGGGSATHRAGLAHRLLARAAQGPCFRTAPRRAPGDPRR